MYQSLPLGTSENTAYVDTSLQLWNASQLSEVLGAFTDRSNTSIGKDWYVLAGNMPAGTQLTFGLILYDDSQVEKQAEMLAAAFQGGRAHITKNVTLKYIHIGNEPNFYLPNSVSYVTSWTPLTRTALSKLKLGVDGDTFLWVGSEVIGYDFSFELAGVLEAAILDPAEIDAATSVLEEHLYSGAPAGAGVEHVPSPRTMMNKATIRSNLSAVHPGMLSSQSHKKDYFMVGSY